MRRPRQLYPQRYTAHETQRMIDLEGVDLASFRSRLVAFAVDAVVLLLLVLIALLTYQTIQGAVDPSRNLGYRFRWSVKEPEKNFLKVGTKDEGAHGDSSQLAVAAATPATRSADGTHAKSEGKSEAKSEGKSEGKEEEDESILSELWELIIPISYWGVLTWATNGRTPGKWVAGIRVASTSHDHVTLWQSTERALGYSASALELGFGFFQYFITPNRRTTHDRIAETIVIKDKDRRLFRSAASRWRQSHEPVWGDAHVQPVEQEKIGAEV